MISGLRIRGLGVIADAAVDLTGGLVAFTGETGAGKTMVVSALGLVLGDRLDTGLVGRDGAEITATLVVDADGPVARRVREAGGDLDDTGDGRAELIVVRTVSGTGRGRAVAGGAPVPVGVLAEIGTMLAQRHSQSDQLALRSTRRQREALDRFAGPDLAAALAAYRADYERFLRVSRGLAEAAGGDRERAARVALLRAEVAEIDDVAPREREDETLRDTIARLSNVAALQDRLAAATALLTAQEDDAGDAASAVARAAALVTEAAGHDSSLAPLPAALAEAQVVIADVGSALRTALDGLRADPAALEQAQQRRARVVAVARKYGGSADAARVHAEQARQELAAIDRGTADLAGLRAELAETVTRLAAAADRVSALRIRAAEQLAAHVTAELAELAMAQASFVVDVARRPDDTGLTLGDGSSYAFGGSGVDVVRFLLVPHPGAKPAPLGDGASGGELSRIMLALEVVLAASTPPGVFVFDEVDAGIGGRTAVEVGRRLHRLARRSQVIVVTHLPQVASFADEQVVVRKDQVGMVTQATVDRVTGADRTVELSRMLSGQPDSDAARAHAEELLDLADRERTHRSTTLDVSGAAP